MVLLKIVTVENITENSKPDYEFNSKDSIRNSIQVKKTSLIFHKIS